MTDKKTFYITTSIPYLNGAPHLGHALEYVQADVAARYRRMSGKDVFFMTGADEHGAKIARSAKKAGRDPKAFVNEQVLLFQILLRSLNISNDDFLRTSDRTRHWPGVTLLWERLRNAGDIYKSSYRGLYCVGHEAFITEKDLEDGKCVDHKSVPEVVEEENYFFRLTKYADRITSAIASGALRVIPETRKNEVLRMLGEAEDISFSRPSKDISWGIPVPGDDTQTMYVWCDALSNYITGIGYGRDDVSFQKWWPADVQMVGKDIMRFHALIWPAMLLAAALDLPKTLFVHGWIHARGEKMSKSTGNIVDPTNLIAKYGADALRFYLIHEIPTFNDGDFSPEQLQGAYDGMLVKGVGNVLSRIAKMLSSFESIDRPSAEHIARYPFKTQMGDLVPKTDRAALENMAPSFWVDQVLEPEYRAAMDRYEFADAIKKLWTLFHMLDQYIEEYKVYKLIKSDPDAAKILLWHLSYSLASAAVLLSPFMPDTAGGILRMLGVGNIAKESWLQFHANDISHLFPKIEL